MNSNQFLTLLKKGNDLQKEDYQQLVKLHKSFPYFQIPAVLAAKYEKENSKDGSTDLLHWAATLSPNRSWLKYLITEKIEFLIDKTDYVNLDNTNAQPVIPEAENSITVEKQIEDENPDENYKKEDSDIIIASTEEQKESLRPEIITDNKPETDQPKPDLIKSDAETEGAPEELITTVEDQATDRPEIILPNTGPTPDDKPKIETKSGPPSNRQNILKQLEDNLSKLQSNQSRKKEEPIKPAEPAKPRRKRGDDLIDSIKKKEKKEIKDSKKKEQNDIIKAFGNKSIKMAAIKENEDVNKLQDLSLPSTKVNDRMVSESYAKLLTQQGKKSAAKEIYKKLILKFPQKKAYFADLIQQLEV